MFFVFSLVEFVRSLDVSVFSHVFFVLSLFVLSLVVFFLKLAVFGQFWKHECESELVRYQKMNVIMREDSQ